MKKKLTSLLLLVSMFFLMFISNSYAEEQKKTIVINMNKTNLDYMDNIPILKEELSKRGYVGLMNIKGDGGSDDKRAYATIGSGGRVNIPSKNYVDFRSITEEDSLVYKSVTNEEPKLINNMSINYLIDYNTTKGQYGSTLGAIGQTLNDNNLKVSVLGNADIGDEENELNRNIALMSMDSLGRISNGNIDDINMLDSSMPYGIRTDYEKLLIETDRLYNESDVLFVELGDTTRLDSYKPYLNEKTNTIMRNKIYKNINSYLSEVFNMVDENDIIYIISATPSNIDYQNKRRLSPVIKFDGNNKGLLSSSTTRRNGIVGNVDIGADILSEYNLKSNIIAGKDFDYIEKDNNLEFLNDEYEKIVSINIMRTTVVNSFVAIIAVSWVLAMIILFLKDKMSIKNKELLFKILKELIKLGLVMPLAFLTAPLFNFTTQTQITLGIIIMVIFMYLVAHLLFKNNDLKQMGLYALLIITVITVDSVFGTYLMKNNIMSYDAIVGARYYGIGNEYEGVTVASIIFGLAVLLHYKKISKWMVGVLLLIVLIPSAHPAMGANVGGAISEFVAYFVFMLLLFDIKFDLKKIILIGVCTVAVVTGFALIDIISGSESHLSLFINQILVNGPGAIIQTFGRKIAMNIKLAKSSIWVNILLAGIFIMATLIFKPKKYFKEIREKYPTIFKGFVASMVGCIVTLLVNDSGIVSASTASIYILVPIIILIINSTILKKDE